MAETKYTIRLSTDYGATVLVETDDASTVKAGMRWAKKALSYLQNGPAADSGKDQADQADITVPVCEVHGIAMVRQQGRFGAFWSCHERTADGQFCSYRPTGQ